MEEIFNAKEMNNLADAYVKKATIALGETINNCIKVRARAGHHDVEFMDEDKIIYIESHLMEYINLGFHVESGYYANFIPMVTISW